MASKESKKTNAKDVPATPSLTSLPNIPNLPSLSNIPQTAPSQMPSQLPPTQMPPQAPPELSEKAKEKIEKIKSQLEKFKKTILKKYPYTLAIGILPPLPKTPLPKSPNPIQNPELAQAIKREEQEKNKTHLILIVPDEKLKEINKYEKFCAESIKALKLDAKFNANTPKEVWQRSFDGHFIEIERIGMAYPIHDKGILGALRVATIHKNLILKKFEKYVVSYVIAGSLVRGQATKTSDVDVYVVIDDTDVKRMPRLELKEKLRAIINNYTFQANDLAASKNKLSCQAYILTEFWESVKDAQPVIFTFIRDGIPLYDRGAFMPWKLLLKMGKIKPSPEAIDSFVLLGEKMSKRVEQRLVDIAVGEIYWGVITPTQAALMLYGLPPPTPLETITVFKQTFIEKEKLIEKRYADTLTKIVETYKKFEHGKLKKVSGKEIDSLLEEANAYIKRLKKLMEQIEKRTGEKTVQKLHNEVFSLLENIFQTKSEKTLIENFSALIKKGEFPKRNLQILKEVKKAKDDRKKNKLTKHEVDKVRKNTQELIAALVEYAQRKELFAKEKARIKISIAGKQGELFLTKNKNTAFLIPDINKQTILKLNLKTKKQTKSNLEELANTLKEPPKKIELTAANLKQLQKILKKDLSLVF